MIAISLFVALSISSLHLIGWSDWWPSLAERISHGEAIYSDQGFFSGPFYPALLSIGNIIAKNNPYLSSIIAGHISVGIFSLSILYVYQFSIKNAWTINSPKPINTKWIRLVDTLLTVIMFASPYALFSSFLRPDDYHTIKYAGLAFLMTGLARYTSKEYQGKLVERATLESTFGFLLITASRLHEGILIIIIAITLHACVFRARNWRKFVCGLVPLATISCVALSVALILITSSAIDSAGLIESLKDAATAKLGNPIILVENIIETFSTGFYQLITLSKKVVKYGILLIFLTFIFNSSRPKYLVNARDHVYRLTKELDTRKNTYLLAVIVAGLDITFFFWKDDGSHIGIGLLALLMVLLVNKKCREVMYTIVGASGNGSIVISFFLTLQSAVIAGFASSGGKIDVSYLLGYSGVFSIFVAGIIIRNYCVTASYDLVQSSIVNALGVAVLASTAVTSSHYLFKNIRMPYSWWGADAGSSLASLLIRSLSERDPNTDRVYKQRRDLLTNSVLERPASLPPKFEYEAVEMCKIINSFKSQHNFTVWSYPHPMPSRICKGSNLIKGTRYTLWYDVTGFHSVQKEIEAISLHYPEFILYYDIDGAVKAHLRFGKDDKSPSHILRHFTDSLVRTHYRKVGSVKTGSGRINIYKLNNI